jgi:hypothetical protein
VDEWTTTPFFGGCGLENEHVEKKGKGEWSRELRLWVMDVVFVAVAA